MIDKKIIVRILLNAWKKDERIFNKDWINQRISIFMKYTMLSLKNQSDKNFTTYVLCHKDTKSIIDKELSNYNKLPENINFVTPKQYKQSLNEKIKNSNYIYLVRLDSDDMYNINFIEKLQNFKPKSNTQVLICQNGYVYDVNKNQIAKYWHRSPQFYTFIYKTSDFLKGKRYELKGGHYGAFDLNHEFIKGYNFINLVHSSNTLYDKNIKNKIRGEIIKDKKTINSILKQFIVDI